MSFDADEYLTLDRIRFYANQMLDQDIPLAIHIHVYRRYVSRAFAPGDKVPVLKLLIRTLARCVERGTALFLASYSQGYSLIGVIEILCGEPEVEFTFRTNMFDLLKGFSACDLNFRLNLTRILDAFASNTTDPEIKSAVEHLYVQEMTLRHFLDFDEYGRRSDAILVDAQNDALIYERMSFDFLTGLVAAMDRIESVPSSVRSLFGAYIDKNFALRVQAACIGLQAQELPTLVLLTMIDEMIPNNFTMYKKWQLIVKVRHFLDRKRIAAGESVEGFY